MQVVIESGSKLYIYADLVILLIGELHESGWNLKVDDSKFYANNGIDHVFVLLSFGTIYKMFMNIGSVIMEYKFANYVSIPYFYEADAETIELAAIQIWDSYIKYDTLHNARYIDVAEVVIPSRMTKSARNFH